jgi:ubiquinone/menaquinone biosynthesis C-methylase UbiE
LSGGSTRHVEYWEENIPWLFKGESLPYEERRRRRYELQDYMLEVIGFDQHRSELVLEIGSGSGIDSAEFGREGAQVVSLDFAEAGARATLQTLTEAGVLPNVIRASAERLPFRDLTFDCVYSFGVLHHTPEVSMAVKEVSRITRPGGSIICMLYNRASLLYAYSILFLHAGEGLQEEELLRSYSERNLGCPFTKAYTKEEACRMFEADYETTASVHYNVIDVKERRKLKVPIPDKYELGWHIILKGKKRKVS